MLESSAMLRRSRLFELSSLALILIAAAYFRWTGLAWDSGYLFHPDERQILLVVSKLQFPSSPLEFFSPNSPLNPKFFAYGSFPLYLLRGLAPFAPPTNITGPWENDLFARWVFFGRWLSGLFDLGTIVLTFALARQVYDARAGLIAAAFVAVTVLHIQLSHFYAVDTLLTFFTLATLYCAFRVALKTIPDENKKQHPKWKIVCGVSLGLALATKITALSLVFPILYACYRATDAPPIDFSRVRILEIGLRIRRPFLQIVGIAFAVFVLVQPYALFDWYVFGRDVIREALVARGWLDYPYTRQFSNTIPFIYQVTQGTIWGMGFPLGIFTWGGGALFLAQCLKTRAWRDTFMLSFALIYFITLDLQYTKYLRYLLPLLPVLYILAAVAIFRAFSSHRVILATLVYLVLVLSSLYSFAFIQIYAREHPWLTASRWIYQNVPAGKTLMLEEWDDALPTLIRFTNGDRRASEYTQIQFPIYDDDTDVKRAELANALSRADLVILASQRGYGSIGKLPARYPLMNRYYQKLFDGELGFEPAETTRNDPTIFGITLRDNPFADLPFNALDVNALLPKGMRVLNLGFADESFSVYDHPQPIIFDRVRALSASELDALLR